MKKCENCIHYGLCPDERMCVVEMGFDYCFKDKSKFIELPCDIGDYCIWHDDLWYVTGIHYFNDRDGNFLLWMSMADKSPCGAEAISNEVKFISEEEANKILEKIGCHEEN